MRVIARHVILSVHAASALEALAGLYLRHDQLCAVALLAVPHRVVAVQSKVDAFAEIAVVEQFNCHTFLGLGSLLLALGLIFGLLQVIGVLETVFNNALHAVLRGAVESPNLLRVFSCLGLVSVVDFLAEDCY